MNLYAKNYKMIIKSITEALNKWKDSTFIDWKIQHNKDVKSPQISL